MTINELITLVAPSYPDGGITQNWDFAKSKPVPRSKIKGDTLAWFICEEIWETVDARGSDGTMLCQARLVVSRILLDVEAVLAAIQTEHAKRT
jgi:hypothetical protein